ncbi:DEAD/DEAH box helicase [Streptococcus sp. 121]|uniref:DEAD/DEAH box helicase n=1 Tax=Streptococcus sp. 121 TaxID=2797637 RepID=UPI001F260E56|nr:DEAD/DEAH box helicase [Streptococcus sp. 121]
MLNRIIKKGVPTKVLMLSATPVNNRFNDLKNQLALAYEGNLEEFDGRLQTKKSVNDIFRSAQLAYNQWSKLPIEERSTQALQKSLDLDFFKLLDSVTIARSRKQIRQFYDSKAIGDFPKRLAPKNVYPDLVVNQEELTFEEIYELLEKLSLTIYQPTLYIHPSKIHLYEKEGKGGLTQLGRETGIKKLMMVNLLKRLESSIEAFRYTLIDVVKAYVDQTLAAIDAFEEAKVNGTLEVKNIPESELDFEDSNQDFLIGKKITINLADMDYVTWKRELLEDQVILTELERKISKVDAESDQKLQTLYQIIDEKMKNPLNGGNKKIIIFSAFATTTDYLYKQVSRYALEKYGLHTAQVSGTKGLETTLAIPHKDLNSLLTYFSPKSKQRELLFPDDQREIDILIATDVISEGQNLQDADTLINYDIHWNPVRIIQRFGRIDRIGSQNQYIQMVNFWPNVTLDSYIDLKARVESRMKISVLTSTADDNLLSQEEVAENNYRKKQLERLQKEVVDLEEMSEGISIMDLGLEDYRQDLKRYLEKHPDLAKVPKGIQAVVEVDQAERQGAIFLLKQKGEETALSRQNRLHPYYLLYLNQEGQSVYALNDAQALLEEIRHLTQGQDQPQDDLVLKFKKETDDGAKMDLYTDLLQQGLQSLEEGEEASFLDELFSIDTLDFMESGITESQDYELLAFIALMKGDQA